MRRFFSKGVNTVLAECTNPAESRQRETKRYKEATGLILYEGGGLPLLLRTSAIPPYTIPPSAPHETSMPFTFLSFRRFPVQCAVTYDTGIQGQGTVRNLSCTGGQLSCNPPARLGEPVRIPNKQRIDIPETVVRWSRGRKFAIEDLAIKPHARARFQHDINRLIQEPAETVHE